MRSLSLNISLLSIFLFFLFTFNSAYSTEREESIYFAINCNSSGQVCSPPGHVELFLQYPAEVSMRFRTPRSHCSRVRVDIEGPLTGSSNFLAANQATGILDIKTLDAVRHHFYITGTGTVGGYNVGTLGSWGGYLDFTIEGHDIINKNKGKPGC